MSYAIAPPGHPNARPGTATTYQLKVYTGEGASSGTTAGVFVQAQA